MEIKKRIIESQFKKRDTKQFDMVGLAEASKITVLYDFEERTDISWMEGAKQILYNETPAILQFMGVYNGKRKTSIYKDYTNIICKDDFNWLLKPKKTFVKRFIGTDFDFLLNLCKELPPFFQFILSSSNAKLRVGRGGEMYRNYHDFMVNVDSSERLDILKTMVDYLSMHNKK